MALDGIFLRSIKNELCDYIGSRIDRIYQPLPHEIVIFLRNPRRNVKLLICADSARARIHLTEKVLKNPQNPPMFCLLLRKRLGNGRLNSVSQSGLDRVLSLEFETKSEIGDVENYVLSVEIMGRHSNIILYDKKSGMIVDAIKRVSESMSRVRPVLPKIKYEPVPSKAKLNILENDPACVSGKVCEVKGCFLGKALLLTIEGISPLISRELSLNMQEKFVESFDILDKTVIFDRIRKLISLIKSNEFKYVALIEKNMPKEFSFIDITQYGKFYSKKFFKSPSELLDFFYSQKDYIQKISQRSSNVIRYLENKIQRTKKTLDIRVKELFGVSNKDEYKKYGDLLSANINNIHRGQKVIEVENFYDSNKPVKLKIDPEKTPVQNIQKYYKIYKKAKSAQKKLKELIENSRNELEFLESELDLVLRSSNEDELGEIVRELNQENYYLKESGKGLDYKKNKAKSKKSNPLKFMSSDGFIILCGKNNKQNDYLTTKKADKNDIWLHTHNIHGSHVVIFLAGRLVSEKTLEEAAIIAAYNSKGRDGSKIPVDYTSIKNVHKPNGAKPGMVIFEKYKTVFVDPDSELVEKLLIDG